MFCISLCLCVVCVRRESGNSEERIQIRRKLKKIEEEEEEKRKEEGLSFCREKCCCSINIDSSVVSSVFNNVVITTCMCTLGIYNRANDEYACGFSNYKIE